MIERVRVANFKAIGPAGVELDLAPLTVLVGPNGVGKTSILEGVCLLAQSVRVLNKQCLLSEGRLVNLGPEQAFADLYHLRRTDTPMHLSVAWRGSPDADAVGCWDYDLAAAATATQIQFRATGDDTPVKCLPVNTGTVTLTLNGDGSSSRAVVLP